MMSTGSQDARNKLRSWLNSTVRVVITDGRTLIGNFCCTDKDANIIIGQCEEYLPEGYPREPRNLGLAMVPGHHIKEIKIQRVKDSDVL